MLLEIISTLGGGVIRLLPEVFKWLNAKQDHDHEYRMTDLQLKIDAQRGQIALDQVNVQGKWNEVMAEITALNQAISDQMKPSGVPLADAMNTLLRPLITVWWCIGLYSAYKVHLILWAYNEQMGLKEKAEVICNEFDRSVIGSIIGYWFMDRTLRKMSRDR